MLPKAHRLSRLVRPSKSSSPQQGRVKCKKDHMYEIFWYQHNFPPKHSKVNFPKSRKEVSREKKERHLIGAMLPLCS